MSATWTTPTGASGKHAGAIAAVVSGDVSYTYVFRGAVAVADDALGGGLVGNLKDGSSITSSWTSVKVGKSGGDGGIGGLTGAADTGSSIKDTYAIGPVTVAGNGAAGGLIGSRPTPL